MNTFLDLLIVVAMVLIAAGVLALALMFLVKNSIVKRVSFYVIVALGLYLSYAALRILLVSAAGSFIPAVLMALVSIGALVLELLSKGDKKKFLIAQLMASAVLIAGTFTVFF